MIFRPILVAACVAMTATGAYAEADKKDDILPLVPVSPCQTHDKDAEAKAQGLADKFRTALRSGDRAAILGMVTEMEAVMAAAPAPYYIERCENGINIYTSNMTAAILVGAMAAGDKDSKANNNLNLHGQTAYATLAFGLGWAYADRRDYDRCITVLEDGLKRDPFDELMIAEELYCMGQDRRNEETVAKADGYLNNFMLGLSDLGKAAILRRKGYALIELARWDEAEKAYKDSLKLDPKSQIAKSELEVIKAQKKRLKAS
ncbi:lipopolysaccharide assembly protein LapB [Asticcacaulis sp. YBE204]|uniref:tetratricopeptide repeat protein n=1 Tax=Asticcacaulis sp. YBE204 TaxID=1282363 RepID=UPI0003C3C900|nr:tetratricopeptide repeat protein [Asticcacaulis sp. YBE204]ESQ77847.1 hypothetical protein AEYBE204_17105 [Asticcacaulis sp. YBE204]